MGRVSVSEDEKILDINGSHGLQKKYEWSHCHSTLQLKILKLYFL